MPTRAELDHFLAHAASIPRPDRDATLTRLHRVTAPRVRRDELAVFAFDHRNPFFELAQETLASEDRLPRLKKLCVEAVAETERARSLAGRVGILCDDMYGQDALNAATGRGWWIGRPVELPGSNPVVFEHGRSVGTTLLSWPREHVVKCLVRYHPDDPIDRRLENEAQIGTLFEAVAASGHELLLEIIPTSGLPRGPDTVLRSLKRLYNLGFMPDWWKLEALGADEWRAVDALIAERDPYCRGVLILGQGADVETLARGFRDAAASRSCRGFAVGRTIFHAPARAWLAGEVDDATFKARVRETFERLVDAWKEARS